MRRLAIAAVAALLVVGIGVRTAAARPQGDCSHEKQTVADAKAELFKAIKAVSDAETAKNAAEKELENARRAKATYTRDLEEAKANYEKVSADVAACRARRANNDCSQQERRQSFAKQHLDNIQNNPPETRVPNAERARDEAKKKKADAVAEQEAAQKKVGDAEAALRSCITNIG